MAYTIEQDKTRIATTTIVFDLIISLLILFLININFNLFEKITQSTLNPSLWIGVTSFGLIFITILDVFLKIKYIKKYVFNNLQINEYVDGENIRSFIFNKQYSLSQSSIDKLFNDVNISFTNSNQDIEHIKFNNKLKSILGY